MLPAARAEEDRLAGCSAVPVSISVSSSSIAEARSKFDPETDENKSDFETVAIRVAYCRNALKIVHGMS